MGLPLNKMMFRYLIAEKWETGWQIPFAPLLLILLLCLGSAVLSMLRPVRQINQMYCHGNNNPGTWIISDTGGDKKRIRVITRR